MDEGFKPCPHCAEPIREAAKICRYCNRQLDGSSQPHIVPNVVHAPSPTPLQPPTTKQGTNWARTIGGAILLVFLLFVVIGKVVPDVRADPDSKGEQYASMIQQHLTDGGFDVNVLYLDHEKTLMLLSDEFKDSEAREAVASKLREDRKLLCSIEIWYAKIGYSKGALSGDVTKNLSFGCPAAEVARTKDNEQGRIKYAASLNSAPGVHVSAKGTVLVAESDEFFTKQANRNAFVQMFVTNPAILQNLCSLSFDRIQLKAKGQIVRTAVIPCK